MRLLSLLVTGVTLVSYALAQDLTPEVSVEKHDYQVRDFVHFVVPLVVISNTSLERCRPSS